MKKRFGCAGIALALVLAALLSAGGTYAEPTLKALVVTGQNNHNWPVSSPILKKILENTGLFAVDIATSPPQGQDISGFTPQFDAYDLIVLDYTGDPWPEPTRTAFEKYVRGGGGVVVYHAADNAFTDWPEYNLMIGLGGWGGRNEKSGPYIRWEDGKVVRDMSPGGGGTHGAQHAFLVVNRDTEHPITKGLPTEWMHAKDELYALLRGPAENLHVLSTAYSAPETKGTGNHEPVLFTVSYGEGRIFHTVLGHVGGEATHPAIQCAGFIVTLQRGAEWAATGKVTQPVPTGFPTDEVRLWPAYGQPRWPEMMDALSRYEYNEPLAPLNNIDAALREATSTGAPLEPIEEQFAALLESDASLGAKRFVCNKLRVVGTAGSVPVLAGMLGQDDTAHMARIALEKNPSEEAGAALRDALASANGDRRTGIIATLGIRREAKAVPALTALLSGDDQATALAAATALGQIGTPEAAEALKRVRGASDKQLARAATDASLVCAERLLQDRNRRAANSIYSELWAKGTTWQGRLGGLVGMLQHTPKDGAAAALEALRSDDADTAAIARRAVSRLKCGGGVSALAKVLSGEPRDTQVLLIRVLSRSSDASARRAITEAAASDDAAVRLAALKGLAFIGGASAVPILAQAAASGQQDEANAAAASLAALRADGVDKAIAKGIADSQQRERRVLIGAAAARKSREATDALLDAARAEDDDAREAALGALAETAEPEHLSPLARLLTDAATQAERDAARKAVVAAACRTPEPKGRALPILDILRAEQRPTARAALLSCLSGVGDESALGTLYDALKDASPDVRLAAVKALANWPTPKPAAQLLAVAEKPASPAEGSEAVRGYVRLLSMPSDRSVADSVALYEKAMAIVQRDEDKAVIVKGLAGLKNDAALPLLYTLLKSGSEDLKAEVLRGLAGWPTASPLPTVQAAAKGSDSPIVKVLALRAYVKLIGRAPNRPPKATEAMYEEALALAPSIDEKRNTMAALAEANNIAAMRVAAKYLDDEQLKSEAAVAAAKLASAVSGAYPQDTKPILEQLVKTSNNEFALTEAKKVLDTIKRLEQFVTAWQVSGPYTKEDMGADRFLDAVFEPETDTADRASWRIMPVATGSSQPFIIDLLKTMSGDNRVAYLRTYIHSPKAQAAVLSFGSDDGIKVWLNGEVIHANNAIRPCGPDQDRVKATLKEGWNPLLVKITQGGGQWAMCLRVLNADGGELTGWRVSPVKPE